MNSIIERVNKACQNVRLSNNSALTFKKVIAKVRKEFKNQDLDVSIKTKKDKTLSASYFYVEAFYDAEDDFNNETPIEVFIYYNFDDKDLFEYRQITDLLIQIFDATVHEYRHQQQSRSREYAIFSEHAMEPFSKYLADPDELDAYSFSIAIELLRAMSKERAIRYMSRITVLGKMRQSSSYVSTSLHSYTIEFKGNPILQKLAKKVYKHLETIDKTKIFL